jgi:hypothetical protein
MRRYPSDKDEAYEIMRLIMFASTRGTNSIEGCWRAVDAPH